MNDTATVTPTLAEVNLLREETETAGRMLLAAIRADVVHLDIYADRYKAAHAQWREAAEAHIAARRSR